VSDSSGTFGGAFQIVKTWKKQNASHSSSY